MQLYPTIKIKNDVAFTCSQPNGTLFRLQIHKPSKDNILFSDKFLQTEDVMSNFFFYFVRVLVRRARKLAQQYFLVYQEPIPTGQLVQRVASVMQEYTQSGCVLVLTSLCLHCWIITVRYTGYTQSRTLIYIKFTSFSLPVVFVHLVYHCW